MFKGHS